MPYFGNHHSRLCSAASDLDFLKQLGGITITTNKLVEKDANDARPPQLSVTGKLTHDKPIEVENYKYLESLIDPSKGEVVKIAIPSATMAHFRGGRASIDIEAYPNIDDFFEDLGASDQGHYGIQ